MALNICSMNCRGLNNHNKRQQVFHWLSNQNFSICFLQESHLKKSQENQWSSEWGGKAFFSGSKTNSEGVCILFNKNLVIDIIQITDLISGRLQVVDIKYEDRFLTLINVYGPNNDDDLFFNVLQDYLSNNEDKTFVIGGDFNTVINIDTDKKNGRVDTHKKCRKKLTTIIDIFELTDIWRSKHQDKKLFTWHSNNKPAIFSRLDFFLLSKNIVNCTFKSNIKNGYKTDHSLITVSLNFDKTTRGPGYFKLNNSLILDVDYQNIVKSSILETVAINHEANPNILWEIIKGNIRNETIRYATINKLKSKENENKLEKEISDLKTQIQTCNNNDTLENLVNLLNNKTTELTEIIDKRIIVRSKADFVENNERNTKLFSNLEKKRSESKVIKQLNINNKTVIQPNEILNQQKLFYESPYKEKNRETSNLNFLNNSLQCLNDNDKLLCEGVLSDTECALALKYMKNNKSPGSDGLSTEFYEIFWNDIKVHFINSFN